MRYAIVVDGTVTNVALWDGQENWQVDGELILLPDDSPVGPGWTYTEGNFDRVLPDPVA